MKTILIEKFKISCKVCNGTNVRYDFTTQGGHIIFMCFTCSNTDLAFLKK